MANTVTLLSYANTFGDWVVTTNALAQENNNLAANNYTKPTGTLYLNDPVLGLQVANNAVVAGQLQVQGVGSSAYVQNNLRVDQQVYFTNTTLGLVNSGQANIGGPLLALGSGNGLQVSNNATVGGNVTIAGSEVVSGTLSVGGNTSISGGLSVTNNAIFTSNVSSLGTISAPQIVGSVSVTTPTLNVLSSGVVSGPFTVGGQLQVAGNFVLTGTTIYTSNSLFLNANSNTGITSVFGVNRGNNTTASIRWNEGSQYWDIRDVNNPTSYSKILTANLISDSVTTVNSSTLASSSAANTLNNSINTLNANLLANVSSLQSQITSNTSSLQSQITANTNLLQNQISANVAYIAGVDAAQNTAIGNLQQYSQSGFARANSSVNEIIGSAGSAVFPGNGLLTFEGSSTGVITTGFGNNIAIDTPQDLRTSAGPTFQNLTINGFASVPTQGVGTDNTLAASTAFVINELNSGGTFGINISGNAASAYGLGLQSAGSPPSPNQILRSDGNGYFYAQYINSSTGNNENPSVSQVITTNGSDGFYRKSSIASFTSQLTGTAPSLTAGLSNGVNQIPNRADNAFYQAVWSNAAGGDHNIYSTNNVTINSSGYGTLGFYASNWTIGGNPSYGLATNTGFYVSGNVWATQNIIAYYSDMRLKKYLGPIQDPIGKLMTLEGFYYEANDVAKSLGYQARREVGVSAQAVNAIMPEIVSPAPIDNKYMTIDYERLVPLLIESIKALKLEIDELKKK